MGRFLVLVDRSRTGSRTAVEKKLVSVVSRDPIDTHTHSTYKVKLHNTNQPLHPVIHRLHMDGWTLRPTQRSQVST